MKKFKLKYKEKCGTIKVEVIRADCMEDARSFGLAICKLRKTEFLGISTFTE